MDKPLITVASLEASDYRSPRNPPEGPSLSGFDPFLTGSITIYVQGVLVKIARIYSSTLYRYDSGSSFTAPQVAGLAAYFAGVPGGGPFTAKNKKHKIISLSRGGDAVDAPGLIYNGVRELQLARSPIPRQTEFANGQLCSSRYADFVSLPFLLGPQLVSLSPTPERGLVLMLAGNARK